MENEHELSYETLTRVSLGSYEHYKSVGAEVEPLEPGFEFDDQEWVEIRTFSFESSSSSLDDNIQQSSEEVGVPSSNTQSISNNMVPNVDEASTSHSVFNKHLEDAYFNEIARIEAIHLCLAYAAHIDFSVFQMYVETSFLNGILKEEVYVGQPLAESEYVAVSGCCAQVLWMRTQLTDYGFFYDKVPIYCDLKSAIAISCNPVQHTRTKHIDVRYHLIKDHVEKGTIELYFVGTEYQLADLFTKSLPEARFKFLVEKLGMMSRET
nr:retrovirus-related Pol polyprotein from transposon TNT 1-94 [Tanacetum cinerariifolium]